MGFGVFSIIVGGVIFFFWVRMFTIFLGMGFLVFIFRIVVLFFLVVIKMIVRVAFSIGSVRVIRCGGGFGELLMGVIIFFRF